RCRSTPRAAWSIDPAAAGRTARTRVPPAATAAAARPPADTRAAAADRAAPRSPARPADADLGLAPRVGPSRRSGGTRGCAAGGTRTFGASGTGAHAPV